MAIHFGVLTFCSILMAGDLGAVDSGVCLYFFVVLYFRDVMGILLKNVWLKKVFRGFPRVQFFALTVEREALRLLVVFNISFFIKAL